MTSPPQAAIKMSSDCGSRKTDVTALSTMTSLPQAGGKKISKCFAFQHGRNEKSFRKVFHVRVKLCKILKETQENSLDTMGEINLIMEIESGSAKQSNRGCVY